MTDRSRTSRTVEPMGVLAFRLRTLLLVFNHSRSIKDGAVAQGGPGGFPVVANGESWIVGMQPSGQFTAQATLGDCRLCYWLTQSGELTKAYHPRSSPVNSQPVTSVAEVTWLFDLVNAADFADWGGTVTLPPRPLSSTQRM